MALKRILKKLFACIRLPRRKPDHIIRPPKEPTITLAQFWESYDARTHPTAAEKKRVFNPFSGFRHRYPVRVFHSMLGVVRGFKSNAGLSTFEENVARTNHFLTEKKFKHFVYQPMQVLFADRERCRIVERVFPGINLEQVKELANSRNATNYHQKKFLERMADKGVSIRELERAAEKAYEELLPFYPKVVTDKHPSNVIILDYNPKTKRCLLTLVDQEWPRKR